MEIYTRSYFASEVYGHDIVDLIALLEYKKCLLIEGPVGTGKTFTAKRLAWSKIGEINTSNILYLKLNEGTTYENVMIRTEKMFNKDRQADILVNINGAFMEICQEACKNRSSDYIVVLDDIDKCDIRKVFGNALGFFEGSCRNEKFRLIGSKATVMIPDNLYIIATASLPKRGDVVDYSLMRVFTHYKAEPAFRTNGFQIRLRGMDNNKMNKLVKVIMDMNEFIAKDKDLGEAYQIGHSYFCLGDDTSNQDVQNIATMEIIPIIQSYWRDRKDVMDNWINKVQVAVQDTVQKR